MCRELSGALESDSVADGRRSDKRPAKGTLALCVCVCENDEVQTPIRITE